MTLTDAGVLSLNGNKVKKSKSQNKLKSKEMDPAQSDSAAAVLPAEGLLQSLSTKGGHVNGLVEETPLESQDDEAKRKEEKKKRKKERREKKERDVSAISVDENAMAVDSECTYIYPVNMRLVTTSYPIDPNSPNTS